jgi:hypothetical protein
VQYADVRTTQKSLCTLRTTHIFTEHVHTNTLIFLVLELQHMLEMPPSRHVFVDVFLLRFVCRRKCTGTPEYTGADKSLARPTTLCILFDGENISFDASLFCVYIYIYIYIVLIFLQLCL